MYVVYVMHVMYVCMYLCMYTVRMYEGMNVCR